MKSSNGKTKTRPGARKVIGRSRDGLSAGTKILAAIEEATEVLRAEGLESNQLTIRTYKVPRVPRVCRSGDVKRVRDLLGASQAVLAGFLGVNVNTVRSWEQGKRLPQPIACRFLSEIEFDPVYWRQRIGQGAVQIEPGNRPEGSGREKAGAKRERD
jgi:putative transcriptional regulator